MFYLIIALTIITASKYLFYVFTSPIYNLSKKKLLKKSSNLSKKEIEKKLRISVVVPAWNEEVGVLSSVKSLMNSDYENMEVILVNDGSTDETDKKVKAYLKSSELKKYESKGKKLIYVAKENGGKGSALNAGIEVSTGEVIVTMDADTVFEKDAIFEVAKYFLNPEIDAAVGNVKVANSKSVLGIIQQIEYTVGFYFKRTHSVFNCEYIIGGAFGAFRKKVFEKYGVFDTKNKTEDIELSTRLQYHGCKMVFIEDAIAYTEGPTTIGGLMKQRLRWKKGRLDTFWTHRELFFSKNRKHNKILTHYLLPITLFYEIELLIEPFITTYGIYYLYTTGDFTGLILWILFTGFINIFAFVFGSKKNSKTAFLFIPVYFILSYLLAFIEIFAMYKSVKLIVSGQDVAWQKWQRKGITGY